MLENMKVVSGRNKTKYDKKVEVQKQKKINDQQLDLIAEMYLDGMKQKDIAVRLKTTPQTISNRMALIRTEFPELLEKNQVNQVNQSNQEHDNVNDNDNDNDNVNKGLLCAVPAQVNQSLACAETAQARKDTFKF